MSGAVSQGKIRLRFSEFVVDPSDADVMRRVLDVEADLLTFEGGSITFWLRGVEVCSFPSSVLDGVELPVGLEPASRVYSVDEVRKQYPKAYERWTPEDDQLLLRLHTSGSGVDELTERFARQPSAIRSRLAKLGMEGLPEAPASPPS
ncbi:hypothetical protein K4B79_46575 [Streptomyces lincolnensis]|uniref:hypothetical protein n=1 Tax=Streptomyces lincolnensis TaxID=1915 RepID=UPI001E593694|nr:hypothetical protein [Streptomyces lincolnensis]MCD7445629.1 hypothetical protein [Streptomyces lincolnensis]